MTITTGPISKAARKRPSIGRDCALGAAMIVAGLVIAGMSYVQTGTGQQVAQATQPSPPAENAGPSPAEGQSRPMTPAPEPARPQAIPDATPNSPGTTGTSTNNAAPPPALPPAPAEKVGEPIKPR